MKKFAALLRGINVSGQKKIKMAELKELFESLSFENVTTYIQSGNVVFHSVINDKAKLKGKIEKAIFDHFGYEVSVLIRARKELIKILNDNPFISAEVDETKLYVVFLETKIDSAAEEMLITEKAKEDKFKIAGTEIYLFTPGGFGRTYYNNNYFERKLKLTATTRNWRTVKKLYEILSGFE